ncbi:MAG: ACP S-malonyltransferase [Termitinemataceae bacterium]|nr:MAG: ACP S-malonyltransferase [Termitinemataceae bacterium]
MKKKKIAFLFSGQGAQYRGMGIDLAQNSEIAKIFELASDIMGQDMKKLLAESDGELLKATSIAQPAITLVNLAAATVLQEHGITAAACAGHSLGEYSALCTAGCISACDTFRLVKERGALMQEAAAIAGGGSIANGGSESAADAGGAVMAAVLGLAPDAIDGIVENARKDGIVDLYVANYNSTRQTVVSGTPTALKQAEALFKAAGARRFMPLKVSGPFHSPLMADAEQKFSQILNKIEFKPPEIPLFSNVSGKIVSSAAETKELLLHQITSPVHWTAIEDGISALGVDTALEVGPGKVLCGLWEQGISGIPCYPAGTTADIEKLCE